MRQIVIRTLRQAGYDWDVREAADGAQALEAVRADEPDVVLSDWNMPEMTGIDLLRRLRAEGYETPFGFVTSEGSPEMRELAEQAGALFLIAKPFTAESFREVIEPVLA
ncbi:chemotaxis response regulator CheY [Cellulomonas oligotrophica]|nr:response regulator [Cellulomonas oligotrophica]